MTERTPLEETSGPDTWAKVLTAALGAEGRVDWLGGSSAKGAQEGQTLAVYLESRTHGAAALHLDKGCAAAIVAGLLRRGERLHPQSDPRAVRRAIAEHLEDCAVRVLGDASARGVLDMPPRDWGAPLVLQVEHQGEVLSATLRPAQPTPGQAPASAPPQGALLSEERSPATSDPLDALELDLPLVVALGTAAPEDVEGWAPGDLWLPDEGWLLPPPLLDAALGSDGAPETTRVARTDRGAAALLLPGARTGIWVRPEGSSLRFDGPLLARDLEGDPTAPGGAVEVRITAGAARLSLARWSALTPGGRLPWIPEPLWTVLVDGRPRAWGAPRRWEDAWGVRLVHVFPPLSSLSEPAAGRRP